MCHRERPECHRERSEAIWSLSLVFLGALACGSATAPDEPCRDFYRESFYSAALIVPGGSSQIGTASLSAYETREGPSLEQSALTRATLRWRVIMSGSPSGAIVHIHDAGGSETPHLYAGSGLASFSGPLPYVPYEGPLPFDDLFAMLQTQTAVFDVHGSQPAPVARGIIAKLIEPISGGRCDSSSRVGVVPGW